MYMYDIRPSGMRWIEVILARLSGTIIVHAHTHIIYMYMYVCVCVYMYVRVCLNKINTMYNAESAYKFMDLT